MDTSNQRPRGRAAPADSAPPLPDEHSERRAALLSLDPRLMRAWADKWHIPLIPCDDFELIAQMHQSRMRDEALPAWARLHSLRTLADSGDAVALEALRALEVATSSTASELIMRTNSQT